MATVVFNGITLWDDTSLDLGQVVFLLSARERLILERHLPRATGNFLKDIGRGSAPIMLGFKKRFSSQAGVVTYAATIDAITNTTISTLAVTSYGSISNCALIEARPVGPAQPLLQAGTTYHMQDWFFTFSRLR